MNKKTKFRIWFPNLKRFGTPSNVVIDLEGKVYGFTRLNENDTRKLVDITEFKELRDYVIQQFTGFFDSDGKEIYEGDILKNLTPHKYSPDTFVVEWGEFHPSDDMGVGGAGFVLPWFFCMFKPEVIGNIFETPDLLLDNSTKPANLETITIPELIEDILQGLKEDES
jgi:hypothetical protein